MGGGVGLVVAAVGLPLSEVAWGDIGCTGGSWAAALQGDPGAGWRGCGKSGTPRHFERACPDEKRDLRG
jgi:hypothetical protein